jgi:hypothetical protein
MEMEDRMDQQQKRGPGDREDLEHAKQDLERAASRLERAREQTREALDSAKQAVSAGASGVAEFTKNVATQTRDTAGRVVEFVKEAEPDEELRHNVEESTETKLHSAGDRLSGAAPRIGRAAETAAEKVGAALHAVAHPLAVVLGAIAGTLGGWWNKARDAAPDLSPADEAACRAHFATLTALPPDMTFERARLGYALGSIAARNPTYEGRTFEAVEPDLRQGFRGNRAAEYDALRDFARYGYGRSAGGTGGGGTTGAAGSLTGGTPGV